MPFKKTKEGWVSDLKGNARIIQPKRNLFENIPPVVVYDGETGYPISTNGEIDWKKVTEDANANR